MNIGVEVEFTGITRLDASLVVAQVTEGTWRTVSSITAAVPYDTYKIQAPEGSWSVVRDRSIVASREPYPPLYGWEEDDYKVELVSPVLTLDTLPVLYAILDALREKGAVVNTSTGIHIHVDAPATPSELASWVGYFCDNQHDIVAQFGTYQNRLERYCMVYPEQLADAMRVFVNSDVAPISHHVVVDAYTKVIRGLHQSWDLEGGVENPERYYALNLASIAKRGTVEFRFFNATLDCGELGCMIDWVSSFCNHQIDSVHAEVAQ